MEARVVEAVAAATEQAELKNETTILLASQAREVGEMYKKLLETTTQERIKFFGKDPKGMYQKAVQVLLVGQQFLDAYEAAEADRLAGTQEISERKFQRISECARAFRQGLWKVLP